MDHFRTNIGAKLHIDLDRPIMPPQLALLIVNKLEQLGLSADDIFAALDFELADLHTNDGLLSFNRMFALIAAALELSGRPWLGLEIGSAETISNWGVLGYAIMSSATEREAMSIGARYYEAAATFMQIRSTSVDERMRVQLDAIHPDRRLVPFCVEESITGICSVTSGFMSEPIKPLDIELTYSKPTYSTKYDEYFDCPICYDRPHNVFWTRPITDAPLRTSDQISAATCLRLVEKLVEHHKGEDDLVHALRRRLLERPGEMPDMEEMAHELAMTSRTLRRKLDQRGTSFSEIKGDARKDLALDYLASTSLNMDQIAARLGYSETTNFRRAFRQWTGKRPHRN
jgi:AraC-like DNA-binding protein